MKNNLAANIRSYRKERRLTQEQLAEVFNVTVGAVHKWEAGISTPELPLMMEIADFFDISLDTLVGYDVRDNRVDVLVKRLRKMTDASDPDAIIEAEKALKKYPNNFKVVCECVHVFSTFGAMFGIDDKLCSRAKGLCEQAIRLVSQSSDPNIDATHLYGQLAGLYHVTGDLDKSLEIYKAHNAGYIYNLQIGQILVAQEKYEEAEVYLSYALLGQLSNNINLKIYKALCYCGKGNYGEARAMIEIGLKETEYYRRDDGPSYMDKIGTLYLTGLAYIELQLNNRKKATEYLKKAKKLGEKFDAAPDFDARRERFIEISEPHMAYDTTGKTCIEGIEKVITLLKSEELSKLWKSINK